MKWLNLFTFFVIVVYLLYAHAVYSEDLLHEYGEGYHYIVNGTNIPDIRLGEAITIKEAIHRMGFGKLAVFRANGLHLILKQKTDKGYVYKHIILWSTGTQVQMDSDELSI